MGASVIGVRIPFLRVTNAGYVIVFVRDRDFVA